MTFCSFFLCKMSPPGGGIETFFSVELQVNLFEDEACRRVNCVELKCDWTIGPHHGMKSRLCVSAGALRWRRVEELALILRHLQVLEETNS